MLLAIDIGNSNVVLGIYADAKWKYIWRLPSLLEENPLVFYEAQLQDYLLESGLAFQQIEQIVISSVVPNLRPVFEQIARHSFGKQALVLGPDLYSKLKLKIRRPSELGTDLYANAFAAHHLFQKDCIVVDFGTALTFTIVDKEGELLGVNIAPGLRTAIHALFLKTAQLPEVPLVLPESVVGKNTTHAIQSGILIGYVGLVRHMIQAIRGELGGHYEAIATGGLVQVLKPLHEDFQIVEPNLTLEGLRLIAENIA